MSLNIPNIEIICNDTPDEHAPRGIGETGNSRVGAAIANAVFNATGKRIRELPLTPEKWL